MCSAAHGSRARFLYLARSAVIEIRMRPSGYTWCSTFESCGRPLRRIVTSTELCWFRANAIAWSSSMTATLRRPDAPKSPRSPERAFEIGAGVGPPPAAAIEADLPAHLRPHPDEVGIA